MNHYVERAAESNPLGRQTADRTKRTGTAAVLGGLLLLTSLAADTLLPDATVRNPTHAAYYLAVGGLFVSSALLLASLLGVHRHRRSGGVESVGLALSGAAFALVAAGSGAQVVLAALGRTDAAELVGFVPAAGLLVGLVASLPLGVAVLRGPGGAAARLGGVLFLASPPGLVAALAVAETSAVLVALAFGAYPLAWVALGYSLRTDASRPNAAESAR